MEFEEWFLLRQDERALEQFYIVLQEDFYNAYLNSGVVFRSQRVCSLEVVVAVVGEQIRPGLVDLLGWTGWYVRAWVREFYASLWIDPRHRFIHFAFRGHDYRLQCQRAREILRILESPIRIHEIYYGETEPPRRPHGGLVPPTDLVRACFTEPFREGLSQTPRDLTPTAHILDVVMRRSLLLRSGYSEGLTRIQLWLVYHLIS